MEEKSNVIASFENGKYTVIVKIKGDAEFKFRYWEIGEMCGYEYISSKGIEPSMILKTKLEDLTA